MGWVQSTADGEFRVGDGSWGEGKRVRGKMKGVGGGRTAEGSAKKRVKVGGYGVQEKR